MGGHFDPFVADVDESGYDEECGPNAQLRCEMGDLSGKHGSLTIGGMSPPRMASVWYDVNFHLAGPFTGELTDVCIISLPSGPSMAVHIYAWGVAFLCFLRLKHKICSWVAISPCNHSLVSSFLLFPQSSVAPLLFIARTCPETTWLVPTLTQPSCLKLW